MSDGREGGAWCVVVMMMMMMTITTITTTMTLLLLMTHLYYPPAYTHSDSAPAIQMTIPTAAAEGGGEVMM